MSTLPRLYPAPRVWVPQPGTLDTRFLQEMKDLEARSILCEEMNDEGYRLEITTDHLRVTLGSEQALRYAWDHVQQLQGSQPEKTPCGLLEDSPQFPRRGFMLDISRCKVPNREGFKQWLKILAGFRYNELQLYTEHTFAYADHETVWKDSSPITPEDISWLQQECSGLGITLVPNQNCFGHFERWIKHPAYADYAETPNGFTSPWGDFRPIGSVIKPDDRSFELVTGLLDELLPHFQTDRVNLGCDETFELGQGATRERCEREGVGAVYAGFVSRIMRYVQTHHGRTPEFWGDILLRYPEEIPTLPSDAVALCWGYEADSPLEEDCKAFKKSGHRFVVCPGTSSWRSFAGRTDNMISNLTAAVTAAQNGGAEGFLLTDWGDCGHLQQEPVSYPALALCAALAWAGPSAPEKEAWEWCDQVAFEGAQGDTACWLAAGRVSEQTGVSPSNSNMLFRWFQSPDDGLGQEVSSDVLREIETSLAALPSPQTWTEEWEQTLSNLRLSLQMRVDAVAGEKTSSAWFAEVAKNHARLWERRNRKGGLAESLKAYSKSAQPNPPESE